MRYCSVIPIDFKGRESTSTMDVSTIGGDG